MELITSQIPQTADIAELAASTPSTLPEKPSFTTTAVMSRALDIAAKHDDAWPAIAALTVLFRLRNAKREALTRRLVDGGYTWARNATKAGEEFAVSILAESEKVELLRTPLAAAQSMVLERMRQHKAECGCKNWTNDWYSVANVVDPDEAKKILASKEAKRIADKAAKKALKDADGQAELPDLDTVQVDPVEFLMAQFMAMSTTDKDEVTNRIHAFYAGTAPVIIEAIAA
jgi:hypothetical protein